MRWGTTGVEIELEAVEGVALLVTDAEAGAPVEHYSVQCVATTGMRVVGSDVRRAAGVHRGGWAWLEGIDRGDHELIVWPEDARWLPNVPRRFVHEGAGTEVRQALHRAVSCPVLVETADGEPLPGVRVELLLPAEGGLVRDLGQLFASGGIRGPVSIRLARAITDSSGRAFLRWFEDPTPLEVRVEGPGVAPHVERDVRVGPGGLSIRVPSAGRLDLELDGAGGHRVVLREVDGSRRLPVDWAEMAELDADGRLRLAVPTGRWRVFLQTLIAVDGSPSRVWCEEPEPLAVVAMQAGRTEELKLDLTARFAACEIVGTAFVDGSPAARLALVCGEDDRDGGVRAIHVVEGRPDERGGFAFAGLHAGHYALQLRIPSGGRQITVPVGDWRRLAPGERWIHDPIVIATSSVTVRVRDARGAPVSGRQLELSAPGTGLIGMLDGDGQVVLECVPAGSYRVRLRAEDRRIDLGSLEALRGVPTTHDFEVR